MKKLFRPSSVDMRPGARIDGAPPPAEASSEFLEPPEDKTGRCVLVVGLILTTAVLCTAYLMRHY